MVRRAAAAGLQGVGPAASASLVPSLHPRGAGTGAGARGREPPRARLRSRDPFQRFLPRGGQRRPRRSRWERSPPRGPQSLWGWSPSLTQPTWLPSPLAAPLPARGAWGAGGASAGTSLAEGRETRSAPCGFCKTAVTTPPRVWVGRGKNGTRKMGSWHGALVRPPTSCPLPVFSISQWVFTGEPSHILTRDQNVMCYFSCLKKVPQ